MSDPRHVRGHAITVKCQACGQTRAMEDDPQHVGAGYPYGWQYVVCRCGGRMYPEVAA